MGDWEHAARQYDAASRARALLRAGFLAWVMLGLSGVRPATAAVSPAADHCPSPITVGTPAAAISTPVVLHILPSTYWQPVGGDIKFELRGVRQPPATLDVYFVWKDIPARGEARPGESLTPDTDRLSRCKPSLRVIQIRSTDPAGNDLKTYTYAARVPELDTPDEGVLGVEGVWHRSWTSLVPQADFYVSATVADEATPGKLVSIMLPTTVGVTTPWVAFVIAGAAFLLGAGVLSAWSTSRRVRGGHALRIISTPTGVASLSQFQIILWTAVIGTGVLYVMLLSGNLIDVPAPTLELLGVTGFTLVTSKLVSDAAAPAPRASLPGIPAAVAVLDKPAEGSVTLTWSPPSGSSEAASYIVESREGGTGPWLEQGRGIGVPPYPVGGLAPATAYQFRVRASGPDGEPGPASAIVSVTTAASHAAAAAARSPASARSLSARAIGDANVMLTWLPDGSPAPGGYTIQYRRGGNLAWTTYAVGAISPRRTLGDLFDYATAYEFRVFSRQGDAVSQPSNVARVVTIRRIPHWADLVMSSRASTEVDMARVQMLIFTTVAAVFTAITVISIGEIPTIPGGELALIGLSNGVYLSSKAVRDRGNVPG